MGAVGGGGAAAPAGWSSPGKPSPNKQGGTGKAASQHPKHLASWYWPLVLVASCLLALTTHESLRRQPTHQRHWQGGEEVEGGAAAGQPMYKVRPLEEQLAGCRTRPKDPVPEKNTSASLAAAMSVWSEEQREVAQKFTAAVSACTSFDCNRRANLLPRAPGQFHHPHFLIAGFPKCATTSVYCHLIQHPQIQHAAEKEPHTLLDHCDWPLECSADVQREYLQGVLNGGEMAESMYTKASLEGSTHYAVEAAWLPERLAQSFPWLKVVISMRDPISQAMALYLHNISHQRPTNCTAEGTESTIFHCVRKGMKFRGRYSDKVAGWAAVFPREQLRFLQYESITAEDTGEGLVRNLKYFLGINPSLTGNQLPLTNWRHQRNTPLKLNDTTVGKSWPLTRREYELLVDAARTDTLELIGAMQAYGHMNADGAKTWQHKWESVWKANMDKCTGDICHIEVSG